MNKLVLTLAALMLAVSATPAQAALVLGGDVVTFTGPGSYSLDITATSIGGDSIAAVALGLNFTNVFGGGDAPTAWAQNIVFELSTGPDSLGGNSHGVTGTSTASTDLVLADGETGVLGTITFVATSAGAINFTELDTFVFQSGSFDLIPTTFSQNSPALTVPEPSSLAALASLTFVTGLVRRRPK